MKKPIILFAIAAMFSSCDKIDNPIKQTGISCGECDVTPDEAFISKKAVLLEEFTGAECTNCPPAAEAGEKLAVKYPEQFYSVGIHAGGFAVPHPPEYPADFRTPEGDELYKFADPLGTPAGLIDRSDYGTNDFVKLYQPGVWEPVVEDILTTTPVAEVGLLADVNASDTTRIVCLTAKFKAISDVSNRDLYWNAYLVESNIIAPQLDRGTRKDDYEHNHVLRTTFGGTFGGPIPEFGGAKDDVACDSRQLAVDENWVWENCAIILFVYDNKTQEVIQTIETHLD